MLLNFILNLRNFSFSNEIEKNSETWNGIIQQKSLAGMKKQETLDLMMKRNKYRVTELMSLIQTQFENRVTEV